MEVFTCKQICLKFLSSHKAENFEDVVANLLHSYDALGCKMSFKMHFLDHIKKFFTKIWEMFQMNTAKDSI